MPIKTQTSWDCRDANTSALWWAEALEWEFEALDPAWFAQLREAGHCNDADVTTLPDGRLSWREGAAIHHPTEPNQRMYFQTVPEPKLAKNRLHIDLHVGPELVAETKQRLIGMGASFVAAHSQGPYSWVVMQDPDGNQFCIA